MVYKDFCDRFRKIRKLKNYTLVDLAKIINHSKDYISQIENAKKQLSVSEFLSICEIFEISPKNFFDENYPFKTKRQEKLFNSIKYLDNKDFELVNSVVKALLKTYNL